MVSESWLHTDIDSQLVHLPGFNLFRNDRVDRIGGGVCMYVRDCIPAKIIYSSSRSNIQFLCVEISNGNNEKCLLVVVYSPPYNFCEANLEELEDTLQKLGPK